MGAYDPKKIEKKWQAAWKKSGLYEARGITASAGGKKSAAKKSSQKPKFYGLIEFPYPSGDGLHVGHIRSNTAMDIISRKRRMEGFDVLYPIGWDAFGLPTENYALKTGIAPAVVTKTNTDNFRRQLQAIGFGFDWSREINTTDPAYYKWTQWIFLEMWKKGLAYKARATVNWCPKDKIVLANEEVVNGCCERCGTPVEKREKEQWMLAITKYADRLDKDLDTVDYLPRIKTQQRNWIGRSEGVNFKCIIKDLNIPVEMYNSVPQTYHAETFTVIAPEHPLVKELVRGTAYEKDVLAFVEKINIKKAANKFNVDTDMEGIFTGRYIKSFADTGRDLPIWIASYVVADYGTGIVNASAHDERDFAFAKKYSIPLREVVEPLVVKTQGEDAFREGLAVSERRAVVAVIKHWSEDKYLGVRWKKTNWQGFIIGGIEGGEDSVEAGIREIKEETGFQNVEFKKKLGGVVHAKFYQVLKKENRFAHFEPALFQLKDGQKTDIAAEEKTLHDLVWLTPEEMQKFITHPDMHIVWDRVVGKEKAIVKNGILLYPEKFKGREWNEVRQDVIEHIVANGYGERKVNYKLRDWVFSRQRYWGEPIPMVHCQRCGWVPLPEKELPLKLPPVKKYTVTETGESPLAADTPEMKKWRTVKCPECGGSAERETDTMPQWAGSSWYFLRYADPKNTKALANAKKLKHWQPVDWYNGGMEHTTLHLLYSRFWNKFLYDIGVAPTSEPYAKRTSHGVILASDGERMSKSRGNVVNPDGIVKNFGADTLRLYEMFMGPFDQAVAWSTDGIVGPRRFLEKVWRLREKVQIKKGTPMLETNRNLVTTVYKTLKKVSADIEAMQFNTAVSAMMILANEIEKYESIEAEYYELFLKILAPFAPHITEELWHKLGHKKSIHIESWPQVAESDTLSNEEVTIVVQVNGKVRGEFKTESNAAETQVVHEARKLESVKKWLGDKEIKKQFYVKGKVISFVI